MDERLPTIKTFNAPTAFPIKPTASIGLFLNTHGEVMEKYASPAPIRSTTSLEKTGISVKPSFLEYISDPLWPLVTMILLLLSFSLI